MLPKLLKIFSNRYKTLNVCHLRAVKYLATKQVQAIGNKNPKHQLKNECLGSIKILFDYSFKDAMSITKRYRTSLLSILS